MNEDQVYDAAEREMDLYRNEVARITAERDDYARRLKATDESYAKAAAERDGAYRERARLVAFLAAVYPSEIIEQPGKFADEWPVIYVDTPAGQLSWHLSRNDLDLFGHVRAYIDGEPKWDGHTTEEKYERLAALIPHALDIRHEAPGACAPYRPNARFREWMKARGINPDLSMVASNFGPGDMRDAYEAGMTAAVIAYAGRPDLGSRPAAGVEGS